MRYIRTVIFALIAAAAVAVDAASKEASCTVRLDAENVTPVARGALVFQCGKTVLSVSSEDGLRIQSGPDGWQPFPLQHPLYRGAACAQDGNDLYLVGGFENATASPRVLKLTVQPDETGPVSIRETELPPLPVGVALAGAAVSQKRLYVAGGTADGSSATNLCMSLDLLSGDTGWIEHPALPAGPRLKPMLSNSFNELVVFGGYEKQGAVYVPDTQVWGYSYRPREGHAEGGWERRAALPSAIAGAALAETGQAHVMLAGGDMASYAFAQLAAGTGESEPVSSVLIFHDVTDTWIEFPQLARPLAGGSLLLKALGDFVLTGGASGGNQVAFEQRISIAGTSKKLSMIDWGVVVLYFCGVGWVGAYFARRQTSSEEYALGGRKMKWWASAISLMATGVSTISFMAIPAMVSSTSMVFSFPAITILIGVLVSAYWTYPMLRRLNITSTYEYLENRFGSSLRLLGSFVGIMGQMLGRMSIVILLPSLAISAITGVPVMVSVLLMGLVTTLYSSFGGFEAVVWTDVAQGLLMVFGFALIGMVAFLSIPGHVLPTVLHYGEEMNRFEFMITKPDVSLPLIWFGLLNQLLMIMSFASDQATAQRVLSTPMKDVRKLAFMSGGFGILFAYMAAAVGFGLFCYFKTFPDQLNPTMKNDMIVPIFIVQKLPVGLAGLMVATLFAASMSTVSTSINSCSVMFSEDFVKRFQRGISSHREMQVMRTVSFVTGCFGTAMAAYLVTADMPSVFETMGRLVALLGGGFTGVYALGMFTRRTHELGAVFGGVMSVIVAVLLTKVGGALHWTAWGVASSGSCIIGGYLFSLIVPWKRKELRGLTIWDAISDEEAEARLKVKEKL